MEQLKEAVITPDRKVRCPVCGSTNGMLTGHETVRNYRIRCKSSRRNRQHFFVLNVEPKKEGKER